VIVPCVLLSSIAVGRNTVDALNDIERPWHLATSGGRSLGRIPNHVFDQFTFYRPG
jgi:hypothetical protein